MCARAAEAPRSSQQAKEEGSESGKAWLS